jgi:hypothetical protein
MQPSQPILTAARSLEVLGLGRTLPPAGSVRQPRRHTLGHCLIRQRASRSPHASAQRHGRAHMPTTSPLRTSAFPPLPRDRQQRMQNDPPSPIIIQGDGRRPLLHSNSIAHVPTSERVAQGPDGACGDSATGPAAPSCLQSKRSWVRRGGALHAPRPTRATASAVPLRPPLPSFRHVAANSHHFRAARSLAAAAIVPARRGFKSRPRTRACVHARC